MGFFKEDLGYYDPLDELVNESLAVKLMGGEVETEDEGIFVELKEVEKVPAKPVEP
jgi:hypothetical protein